jgi:hypothetical protein
MTANARHIDTLVVVNFNSAAISGTPTTGKVVLIYDTSDFTVLVLYDVQITYTDGAGYVRRYPSEGGGLRLRLNGANA